MFLKRIRNEFPFLLKLIQRPDGTSGPLVYLDNAATTQKPRQVIDRIIQFYVDEVAPVHRSVYPRAEKLTAEVERVRALTARFINATHSSEIIFCSGSTYALNQVAFGWALHALNKGDQILLTHAEHHSNSVVWQQVARRTGAQLIFVPVDASGRICSEQVSSLITPRTKLFAVTLLNHVTGLTTEVGPFIEAARAYGAKLLFDVSQAVAHVPVDVQLLEADFVMFSGHKLFAPTGIGVLYIKKELQSSVQPLTFGGGAIVDVLETGFELAQAPTCFEAGSLHVEGVIGLGAALEFLMQNFDYNDLKNHEAELSRFFVRQLQQNNSIKFIVEPELLIKHAAPIVSFYHERIHAHDIAAYLGQWGICVRAGLHCAHPLAQKLQVPATVRVSFAPYNTLDELEQLLVLLARVQVSFL